MWGKSKWPTPYFQYILIDLNLAYNKNKLYKNLGYWLRDMSNFDFLKKGLGIVSRAHFVYDFSRKKFLMFNWPDFIVWLLLFLEILGNMCIAIVCFPGCDVINFEINLIFLIKPFFYMIKKLRQKFKYLENEMCFQGKIKSIFHHFKVLSVTKSCLEPESAPLNGEDSNWSGDLAD